MTHSNDLFLSDDRYFDPDPQQRSIARDLYERVAALPLICPHGHVDPRMFADPDYSFGSPAELFIIPDHYVFRMLYSQGIPLESLGIPRLDGKPVEQDHRKIWQLFAEHFYLFRGTPTGIWLKHELYSVFNVRQRLDGASAQSIYDQIQSQLQKPEYRPRKLYERFNVEVLCTTDMATSNLEHHIAIQDSGWVGRILPTFRPDDVINIDIPGWRGNLAKLESLTGVRVHNHKTFLDALQTRRQAFIDLGAKATDHDALTVRTGLLTESEADAIFSRALKGQLHQDDALRFKAHMLMESARMSIEDGLVMQLHSGSYRNHNQWLYEQFGPDKGSDTPIAAEFTRNLHPLLNRFATTAG